MRHLGLLPRRLIGSHSLGPARPSDLVSAQGTAGLGVGEEAAPERHADCDPRLTEGKAALLPTPPLVHGVLASPLVPCVAPGLPRMLVTSGFQKFGAFRSENSVFTEILDFSFKSGRQSIPIVSQMDLRAHLWKVWWQL